MEANRGFAVERVSLYCGRSDAKMKEFTINSDMRTEMTTVNRNSLEAAFIAALFYSVLAILSCSGKSKIFATIIKSIVIVMIAAIWVSFSEAENFSVHKYSRLFSLKMRSCAGRVKRFGIFSPTSEPFIPRKPFEIAGVNNCDLILRKRNGAIFFFWGWHGWLLDSLKCMSAETLTTPAYQRFA